MHRDFLSVDETMRDTYQLVLNLVKLIVEYESSEPYRIVGERLDDPDFLSVVYFEQTVPLPKAIGKTAKSIANELRSALDYAAYVCRKPEVNETNQSSFPFAKYKRDFQSTAKRGSRDMHPDIYRSCAWFKPYGDEDGDAILSKLNEVRRVATHRMITPVIPSRGHVITKFQSNFANVFRDPKKNQSRHTLLEPRVDYSSNFDLKTRRLRLVTYDHEIWRLEEISCKPCLSLADANAQIVSPQSFFPLAWHRVNEVLTVMKYEAQRLGICNSVDSKSPNH